MLEIFKSNVSLCKIRGAELLDPLARLVEWSCCYEQPHPPGKQSFFSCDANQGGLPSRLVRRRRVGRVARMKGCMMSQPQLLRGRDERDAHSPDFISQNMFID